MILTPTLSTTDILILQNPRVHSHVVGHVVCNGAGSDYILGLEVERYINLWFLWTLNIYTHPKQTATNYLIILNDLFCFTVFSFGLSIVTLFRYIQTLQLSMAFTNIH